MFPEEMQAARLRLIKTHPYLASAAWALEPVEKPGLGTMGVDMWWRLYYDPAVITHWTVEELSGVFYHEILHLLRDHSTRMKDYEPRLSNICTDAEINDDLITEGIILPSNPITPKKIGQPDNLLAEEYYAALEKSTSKLGSAFDSKDGSSNNLSSQSEALSKPSHQSGESHTGGQVGNDDETPIPGSGRCGSCATGQQELWEEGPPNGGTSPGINRAEAELIRRDVARQIEEHIKSQGTIPGHLERWAKEKLSPKVNWRKELAAAIRHAVTDVAGAVDYSYKRPSRRQGQVGNGNIVLPSLRKPIPSVAVVVDTSGSVNDTMLSQALAEISGILKGLGQREGVHVLAVDADVQACTKVFRPDQVQVAGGGGTDMGKGLEAASKLRPKPQICIVITDGYTPWPSRAPHGMKTIVALTEAGKSPDWAKTIKVY